MVLNIDCIAKNNKKKSTYETTKLFILKNELIIKKWVLSVKKSLTSIPLLFKSLMTNNNLISFWVSHNNDLILSMRKKKLMINTAIPYFILFGYGGGTVFSHTAVKVIKIKGN